MKYPSHTELYTQELFEDGFKIEIKYHHGVKIIKASKGNLCYEYVEIPELTGDFNFDVRILDKINKIKNSEII